MPKTDRGYGAAHKRERSRWKKIVEAGEAECVRCARPIRAGAEFHLDHTRDRTGYLGVSHPFCNLSAGGRLGGKLRSRGPRKAGEQTRLERAGMRRVSRDWVGDATRIDGRLYRPD